MALGVGPAVKMGAVLPIEQVPASSGAVRRTTDGASTLRGYTLPNGAQPSRRLRSSMKKDQPLIKKQRRRKSFVRAEAYMETNFVQSIMTAMLIISLYLPDLWVAANINDDRDAILSGMLTAVFMVFLAEVIILSVVKEGYIGGFFFWMDVLGTFSVLLDIGWISDSIFGSADGSLLRAARAAKLGARSGRLAKLLKVIRIFHKKKQGADEQNVTLKPAKAISEKLSAVLARRIAALVMIIVLLTPLLEYKEVDRSPKSFLATFDTLSAEGVTEDEFQPFLEDFRSFYYDKDTFPLTLTVANVGTWDWTDEFKYVRSDCEVDFESISSFTVFSYSTVFRLQAMYSMILISIVIVLLLGFAMSFNSAVDKLVIVPLERMINTLRQCVSTMVQSVKAMDIISPDVAQAEGEPGVEELDDMLETDLLEQAIQKLATIVQHQVEVAGGMGDIDTGNADKGTQQWIASMNGGTGMGKQVTAPNTPQAMTPSRSFVADSSGLLAVTSFGATDAQREELAAAWEKMQTWAFDPLALSHSLKCGLIEALFMNMGILTKFTELPTMSRFVQAMGEAYLANPYHNFSHAVDVMHACYKYVTQCEASVFLSELEIYSLLIAALAHDMGHFALNNAYLIKAQHDLALQHNDQSPLESMHCAQLYATLRKPELNVFEKMDETEYTASRAIVLKCILGTDMKHHFSQIGKTKVFLDMHTADLDMMQETGQVAECFSEKDNRMFIMELYLHAADISNPIRPFSLCQKWADLVVQEFFAQGDLEKSKGWMASPMCDRETTNMATMQLGFIEFVVAPLYQELCNVFPVLDGLLDTMLDNHQEWAKIRANEVKSANEVTALDDLAALDARVSSLQSKVRPVIAV